MVNPHNIEHDLSETSDVSKFWDTLGAQHTEDLDEHGFHHVKRRHAFRYFNWNWQWRSIHKSEQMRYLLTHSSARTIMRCLVSSIESGEESWQGAPLSRTDRWLYTFAVRLLWEHAAMYGDAEVLSLPEPLEGGPLPVYWRGRLISQDLANGSLEIAALRRGLDRKPSSILEVGAGYGRTAYLLLSLFPEAEYTIVDIEPAISISRWYLTQLFPPKRLRFLKPTELANVGPASYDLGLSISSLQEMTQEQIAHYIEYFDSVCAGGSVFLKQWTEWYNPADRMTARFSDYPIPAHWQEVFREPARVQTRFTQAGWNLPKT